MKETKKEKVTEHRVALVDISRRFGVEKTLHLLYILVKCGYELTTGISKWQERKREYDGSQKSIA